MLSPTELQDSLCQFTDTEAYHGLTIFGNLLSTDGIKFLAEKAQAFWLVTLIASYQPKLRNKYPEVWAFQVWEMNVRPDKSAVITCASDCDEEAVITEEIPFTDFPLPYIKLYVCQLDERRVVLMLPSEY